MGLKTHGTMAVDWEQRIDFDRLRRERLARAKALLAKSEMGALLCFDMNNVRYLTATHIGTWAQDKANRFTLLSQYDDGIASRSKFLLSLSLVYTTDLCIEYLLVNL